MSASSSSENDTSGAAGSSEGLFEFEGWVRKDVYDLPNDSDKAEVILRRIFATGESLNWCTWCSERKLTTHRQWHDIPEFCSSLELIQDYPLEFIRSKWGKAYVKRRLGVEE